MGARAALEVNCHPLRAAHSREIHSCMNVEPLTEYLELSMLCRVQEVVCNRYGGKNTDGFVDSVERMSWHPCLIVEDEVNSAVRLQMSLEPHFQDRCMRRK